jgi:hypothetical protein
LIYNKTAIFILDKSDLMITMEEIKVSKNDEKPLLYTQNRMYRNGSYRFYKRVTAKCKRQTTTDIN